MTNKQRNKMDNPSELFEAQATPEIKDDPQLFNNKLADIKNDGGDQKYKDLSTALDALKASQEFIPELTTKLSAAEEKVARLEAELATREDVAEILGQMTVPDQKVEAPVTPAVEGLSEDTVQKLIADNIAKRDASMLEARNSELVVKTLITKYGTEETAKKAINNMAAKLETDAKTLGELAKRNPSMVLGYFEGVGNKTPDTQIKQTINTPNFTPKEGLAPPEKSLLSGATASELGDYMAKIKEEVYKELDVQT